MRYVRAVFDPTTHALVAVQQNGAPFATQPPKPTWCDPIVVDVGAFEDDAVPAEGCFATYVMNRIEFDPETNAARLKPGVADLPAPHATPTTVDGIKAHLDQHGRRNTLAHAVRQDLAEFFAEFSDAKPTQLSALGMTADEIWEIPKFKMVQQAQIKDRIAAMEAENAAKQEEKLQARIDRKIEASQ